MKTNAAVLYSSSHSMPFAESQPLHVEEVEVIPPGYGQVLVEMVGAGLCHSDLSVFDGSRPRPVPMILGHEASGIVREVGDGVHDLKPDDHVIFSFVPMCGHCIPCATGRPALCENGAKSNAAGTLLGGDIHFQTSSGQHIHHHLGVSAFSQYTVAAQQSLLKIDRSVPLEKAALFGCALITGVGAVINTARVEAGMAIAVFGMGGVGLSSIMGAKLVGAYPVIAVDLLDSKLELAKKLGATHVVNASRTDAVQAVRDLTGGGAHYAFESVGSERVLAQAYGATRRGGTTLTVGLPDPAKQLTVPALSLTAEERTIKGSFMGSAVPRRDIPRLIQLYQAGLLPIDLLITRSIALGDINSAFDALARGEAARQLIHFKQ